MGEDTTAVALTAEDAAAAELIKGLWGDPKTRGKIADAIETKHPGSVPGFGLSKLQDKMTEDAAKLTKLREDAEKDAAVRELAKAREGVVRVGLTMADVTEVEKVMQEELIGTHTAAAELVLRRRREQVAAPRSRPGGWQLPGQEKASAEFFKGIETDRRGWARDKAYDLLEQFDRQRAVGAV